MINGVNYRMRVMVNSRDSQWSLDLSSGGVDLVNGVAMVGGVDIFKQYPHIEIKNAYIVNTENPREDPTPENLGTYSKFVIFSDEEIGE